jgi:hypothetical protein
MKCTPFGLDGAELSDLIGDIYDCVIDRRAIIKRIG